MSRRQKEDTLKTQLTSELCGDRAKQRQNTVQFKPHDIHQTTDTVTILTVTTRSKGGWREEGTKEAGRGSRVWGWGGMWPLHYIVVCVFAPDEHKN